ncbi:MAG: hypothetical protein AABX13_01730 [Nanoarchaeota archaeon]
MTLTDKIRAVADTLRGVAKIAMVGSIGFGAGAITFTNGGIIDVVQKYRREAELEQSERQRYEYEQRRNKYVPPHSNYREPPQNPHGVGSCFSM